MIPALDATAHRPWPLPSAPWVLAQSWLDVLFAHWRVSAGELQRRVPEGLEVETFDGTGWIGIIPLFMSDVHARGLPPFPGTSEFPEVNVRTYVRRGAKPGVYFFSLDASNRLAVEGARTGFGLQYYSADMSFRRTADGFQHSCRRMDSRGAPASLVATYRGLGGGGIAEPGSLEHFLCERYCLYAGPRLQRLWRTEIHHAPWELQPAEATFDLNTIAEPLGLGLQGEPHLLFSPGVAAATWLPSAC